VLALLVPRHIFHVGGLRVNDKIAIGERTVWNIHNECYTFTHKIQEQHNERNTKNGIYIYI